MNSIERFKKNWYAVYTKSHCEKKVNEILKTKKVVTFLPLRKGRIKIAGNFRFVDVPLFTSYLFVNICLADDEHYRVLETTGVSTIVKIGKEPAVIPSVVIESLKKLVTEMKDEIRVITSIQRGDKVKVIDGPLRGAVGEMVRVDHKRYNFVVNVELLGRGVEVTIPPEYVHRI